MSRMRLSFRYGWGPAAAAVLLVAACGGSTPSTATGSAQTGVAGQVALSVPVAGSGGFNYTQGSYLEGFEFTVAKSISVTALGAYDSNLRNPSSESFMTVPVALYDLTSHTRLGEVSVSAGDAVVGIYRYAPLSSPIALQPGHDYTVAWVSLADYYIASPTLKPSAVNPAITYVAMDGNGPGGLTTTSIMLEPNWFYTESANGLSALNYDLGPNFMFSTS